MKKPPGERRRFSVVDPTGFHPLLPKFFCSAFVRAFFQNFRTLCRYHSKFTVTRKTIGCLTCAVSGARTLFSFVLVSFQFGRRLFGRFAQLFADRMSACAIARPSCRTPRCGMGRSEVITASQQG